MKKHFFLYSTIVSTLLFSLSCTQHTEAEPTKAINNPPSTQSNSETTSSNNISREETQQVTESESTTIEGTHHQLKTVQGETITIVENGNIGFDFPQYKGKIVVFQIFGKDCEFCEEELPIINQIKNSYGSQLKVVAIQAQDRMTPSEKSSIISRHQIDYPIIEGNDARPLLRFITKTYGWRGILPYILILKDGATEYSFSDGSVSHEEFQESIKTLL